MWLVLLLVGIVALLVLVYLLCYGGYGGPIDWLMTTRRHGRRDRPTVALTFDDGPDPVHTPALLDVLSELDAKATFFLIGEGVAANPSIAHRIAREGHELGNHTYCHRYLPLASTKSVERELVTTDQAIEQATGIVPAIARPPWGGRSPWTVRAFARLAKQLVTWDVNSYDWKGKSEREVIERVLDRTRAGSIILMHEARKDGATTVEIVRKLVPALRARGFELVTVSAVTA